MCWAKNIKKYDVKLFEHFSILNMSKFGEDLFEYRKNNSFTKNNFNKVSE